MRKTKQLLWGGLIAVIGAAAMPLEAGAALNVGDVISLGDFNYKVLPNREAALAGYSESSTKPTVITIPETITSAGETLTITEVADKAFQGKSFNDNFPITTVTFPKTVKRIGKQAFYLCKKLATLNFSEGLKTIDYQAFGSTAMISQCTFPASLDSIGDYAFTSGVKVENFVLPATVKYVGMDAFWMNSCKTITISSSTKFSSGVFKQSDAIKSFTFPEGMTQIPASFLLGCTALTDMTIPASVTQIGGLAFSNCKALETMTCYAATPPTTSSNTFNGVPTTCTVKVPEGSIEAYKAASNWSNFTTYEAIAGTGGGSEPQEPEAAGTEIVIGDFKYIVTQGSEVSLAGYSEASTKPVVITIPETIKYNNVTYTVTQVADQAFKGKSYNDNFPITTVTFPKTVKRIGKQAFYLCKKLATLNFSEGLKTIDYQAFGNTAMISNFTLPTSLDSIASYAFTGGVKVENLVIPSTVKFVGEDAFWMNNCKTITISEKTNFSSGVFKQSYDLTSFTFPEGMALIPGSFLSGCTAMTEVTIPGTVTQLGTQVFATCKALTTINCHAVTPPTTASNTFMSVPTTCTVLVPKTSVEAYKAADNWKNFIISSGYDGPATGTAFEYDGLKYEITGPTTAKVTGPVGGQPTELTIPAQVTLNDYTYDVTCVGKEAFDETRDDYILKKVTLPNTIKVIEDYAFYCCKALESINLPEGLTSIGEMSFGTSKALKELHFPSTLEIIGDYAFTSCGVSELVIPATVKKVGNSAFWMGAMSKITISPTTQFVGTTFNQADNLVTVTIPEGFTTICNGMFQTCKSLENVQLPSTLTSIGAKAFNNCTALKRLGCSAVTPPTCGLNSLGTKMDVTVIVPQASLEAYKSANVWKDFLNTIKGSNEFEAYLNLEGASENILGELNKPVTAPLAVYNYGLTPVTSVGYEYTVSGTKKTGSVTLSQPLSAGSQGIVPVTIDAFSAYGQYTVPVTLTTVNSKTNLSPNKSYTATINVLEAKNIPAGSISFARYTNDEFSYIYGPKGGVDVAMKVKDATLRGKKIVGMKVAGLSETGLGNFNGWLANKLGTKTLAAGGLMEQGEMTVVFDTPYEINVDSLYAGYHFENFDGVNQYTIPVAAPENADGGCYKSSDGSTFTDISKYGTATITLYLSGNFAANAVNVAAYTGSDLAVKGTPYQLTFTLEQQGFSPVSSVDYTYAVNGVSTDGSATVDLPASMGSKAELTIDCGPIAAAGSYPATFKVTKVNSQPNEITNATASLTLRNMSFKPVNRPLLEEGTGCWCGYCTRGWVGMKQMNLQYPGFVGAVWHNNDPMMVTSTYPFPSSGYPTACINRNGVSIDPYFGEVNNKQFGIYDTYSSAAMQLTDVDIDVATAWGVDKATLEVTTTVKSAAEAKGYKIGYLLLQNGLHSTETPWNQVNNYEGKTSDPYLSELSSMGNPIKNLMYDEVVITPKYSNGVANSLPASLETDGVYTHKLSIPTVSYKSTYVEPYELLVDKDKLYLVALVIDANGRVANAVRVKAGDATTSIASDAIDSESEETLYYDLMGRRILNPGTGIFIKVQGHKATKVTL